MFKTSILLYSKDSYVHICLFNRLEAKTNKIIKKDREKGKVEWKKEVTYYSFLCIHACMDAFMHVIAFQKLNFTITQRQK
jgi:hypothetical protein